VLNKITGFLDYGTRKICRLVCRKLKAHVDEMGLCVKIDSRNTTSSDLSKSVRVDEGRILFLKSDQLNLEPQHLEDWKVAVICGPIDTNWIFNGFLRNCSNLRILVIRGECLTSQDFRDPTEPLPMFQHLTDVEFMLSSKDMTASVEKVHKILNIKPSLKAYKSMDARMQKNMACLLKNIRSRVLKVFTAFVMANIMQSDDQRKIRWEHNPLYEFLERHSSTLEIILVAGLFSGEMPSPCPVYRLPTNIKLLNCRKSMLNYWKDLLLAQNSLQQLAIHHLPGTSALPMLQTVIGNNAETLTFIELSTGSGTERIQTLDLKMFQCCDSLESFSIDDVSGNHMVIRNLNNLPRTRLTALKFTSCEIAPDFDGVKFMEGFNPKALMLITVWTGNTGFFGDQKYLLKFIELVLRCRNLDSFTMMLGLSENSEVKVRFNFSNLVQFSKRSII